MIIDRSSENKDHSFDDNPKSPSKSAKKREMLALQALGKKLASLPHRQFTKLIFDDMDELRYALEFFRNLPLKQHEARRRQMQFIGKMMRHVNADSLEAQIKRSETLYNKKK